jgi:apolipoprotein N-acyltransferase
MVASTTRATLGARSLAALATAGLLFAAFPPLEWTALAFLAWAPLALARTGTTGRVRRGLNGLMLGVLFGLIATTVNPPEVVTGVAWFGISAGVGVVAGLAAAALDVPVGPERLIRALGPWARIWVPAVAWTGIEYLRLMTTAGHQWGMLATTQVDVAPLRAWLPVAGMWPVALLTVATGQAIGSLVLVAVGRLALSRSLVVGVGIAALGWLVGLGLAAVERVPEGPTIRVATVQTGDHVPSHPRTRPLITTVRYRELTDTITDMHTPATLEAVAQGADLVVWPEASGWVAPDDSNATAQLDGVREAARLAGVPIVWSYFIRIDPNRTRNEVVVVTPDGQMSRPTTKDHPVYAIGERSVTAGLYETYEVAGTRLGLAAGPDGTYTDTLARLARMGATLVAIPTHDWAAYTAPHFRHLQLRAAEHRLAIAKADWRYGSVVIAPDGEVVSNTSLDEAREELLVADVPLDTPGTLYTATGDWLGVVSLGALAVMMSGAVVVGWRDRRSSGGRPESATHPS